ncbi:MAG: hypothetical protein GY801_19145 [bacterium]|nr:hypothetical protein [bacterium]
MKPNSPAELENYRYDQESSQTPLSARVLGWLALVAFAVAVYSTFFLSGEQMILMCYVSYGGFAVLFSAYAIVKIVTRHSRCSQCRQIMDVIDVKWTPDQWQQIQGYEQVGSLNGADGYLYTIDREKETGRAPHCSIWVQLQQWCACHQCRVYFLKAQHSRKRIFSTRSDDEFEQAKHVLLTDPKASDKMELAYNERLQERQKSE